MGISNFPDIQIFFFESLKFNIFLKSFSLFFQFFDFLSFLKVDRSLLIKFLFNLSMISVGKLIVIKFELFVFMVIIDRLPITQQIFKVRSHFFLLLQ